MKKTVLLLAAGAVTMFIVNGQITDQSNASVAKTKERIWQAKQLQNS